jgi:hypothetical protein
MFVWQLQGKKEDNVNSKDLTLGGFERYFFVIARLVT